MKWATYRDREQAISRAILADARRLVDLLLQDKPRKGNPPARWCLVLRQAAALLQAETACQPEPLRTRWYHGPTDPEEAAQSRSRSRGIGILSAS